MSDPFTEIRCESGAALGEWGYVGRDEAIELLRKHLERERDEAERGLKDIAAGAVKVYHQRGPYAAKDRREV